MYHHSYHLVESVMTQTLDWAGGLACSPPGMECVVEPSPLSGLFLRAGILRHCCVCPPEGVYPRFHKMQHCTRASPPQSSYHVQLRLLG